MDLIHNVAIRITTGPFEGFYRVLLDEPVLRKTALIRLDPPLTADSRSRGGRKRLPHPTTPRKKPRAPLLAAVLWVDRDELLNQGDSGQAFNVEFEARNAPARALSEKSAAHYRNRQIAAAPFLDLATLRDGLLSKDGIATLIKDAMKASRLSRSAVYNVFSLLCRYGFSERSLILDHHRCGAPGKPRPCDPAGRKKAGRKTTRQQVALRAYGILLPPDQPGTSARWRALILAADRKIPAPKPPMSQRVTRIIDSEFVKRYHQKADGTLVPADLERGSYPNRRQIRQVLETGISRLQRFADATTKGHYQRALRGLQGCSRQGTAGPGHTWAIDSTVGDIYLRSSINRAWIIGRPIVYIIVDVWSTAVVGYYVCLMGPSWDMAKLALFCAGSDPALIGSLWGYQPLLTLKPAPTLCARLLCDRGEYLSQAAKQTGIELLPSESYTPPYRPDMKGLVEVLHRIAKDKLFFFVPGAIDARRAEYELRRFNPNEAALTVREFVHLLDVHFTEYNLTAPRDGDLDAHMKAEGVAPCPAGLWHWGHAVGMGYRRAVSKTDLITELLPSANARIRRNGIFFAGRHYGSEFADDAQWTSIARAFGGWNIPCNYFPGSVSRLWTPKPDDTGLLELMLADHSTASHELTMDEVADAEAFYRLDAADREHARNLTNLSALKRRQEIIANAERLTAEAREGSRGPMPNMTEAREMERSVGSLETPTSQPESSHVPIDNYDDAYRNTMRQILEGMNNGGRQDD